MALVGLGPWQRCYASQVPARKLNLPPVRTLKIPYTYEIFYYDEASARRAAKQLDGTQLVDRNVMVTLDTDAVPATKINVQNIATFVTYDKIREHFAQAGPVSHFRSYEDCRFGEVFFRKNPDIAWDAVQLKSGTEIRGKKIRVELDCSTEFLDKVIVHGLPRDVSWQDLRHHFGDLGECVAKVHGGFTARVHFKTLEAAKAVFKSGTERLPSQPERKVFIAYRWDSNWDVPDIDLTGITPSVTETEIRECFSKYGQINSVEFFQQALPPEFLE